MPDTDQDQTTVRKLDPSKLELVSGDDHPLRMTLEGDCSYPRVRVVAAFPLTAPDQVICFLDAKDNEIGEVESIAAFTPEQRAIVETELAKRYYMPVITRIKSVKDEFGLTYWEVDTDRGPKEFVLRGSSEHVTEVSDSRLMIVDIEGNRFELRDWDQLDSKSYGLVVRLL